MDDDGTNDACEKLHIPKEIINSSLPRVLIISTTREKADELALGMGAKYLINTNGIQYYLWNIENKYYKTEVYLLTSENLFKDILFMAEAIIIHHDPCLESANEKLKEWSMNVGVFEVRILSCDRFTDEPTQDKVSDWCLRNKFELVELSQREIFDNLASNLEYGKYGIDRIIEALHAHKWSNILEQESYAADAPRERVRQRKRDKKNGLSCNTSDEANIKNQKEIDVHEVEEQLHNISLTQDSMTLEEMDLLDADSSDFGQLISNLMAMKEHVTSLPTNQRRKAAEQLVTAFWKSLGGDASEISD